MTLHEQAASLGIKVDGRWSDKRIQKEIERVSGVVEPLTEPRLEDVLVDSIEAMNAYALRIWSGQSPDMLKQERIDRVKAGLTAQGWGDIFDHLSLPDA